MQKILLVEQKYIYLLCRCLNEQLIEQQLPIQELHGLPGCSKETCHCGQMVQGLSTKMTEMRQAQQQMHAAMEDTLRHEMGKIARTLSPYVDPSVRVGDNFLPINGVEEVIVSLRNKLLDRDKQLGANVALIRLQENVIDTLSVDKRSLKTEQKAARNKLAHLQEYVKGLEAEIQVLKKKLQKERKEVI